MLRFKITHGEKKCIYDTPTVCRLVKPATFTFCLIKQYISEPSGLLIVDVEVTTSEAGVECMCQL